MLLSMCVRFVNTSFELVRQVGLNNSLTRQQFKWPLKENKYFFQKSQICNDPSKLVTLSWLHQTELTLSPLIIKMLTI